MRLEEDRIVEVEEVNVDEVDEGRKGPQRNIDDRT